MESFTIDWHFVVLPAALPRNTIPSTALSPLVYGSDRHFFETGINRNDVIWFINVEHAHAGALWCALEEGWVKITGLMLWSAQDTHPSRLLTYLNLPEVHHLWAPGSPHFEFWIRGQMVRGLKPKCCGSGIGEKIRNFPNFRSRAEQ